VGRPRKPEPDRRRRWSVLNVTPAERDAITANAEAAGLSLSAYVVQAALERPPAPRQDWRRIVRQQAYLAERLDEIAAALVQTDSARDAGRALLALRRIEREIAAWRGAQSTPGGEGGDGSDRGLR